MEFDAGNYKWRLVIYPNGHGHGIKEEAEEYVSVYLAISDTESLPKNWEVNAVFSIFILNQISGNYLHSPGNSSRFFGLKTEWGIPKFISKKYLSIPSSEYLVEDSCVFGAEVFVIDKYNPVTEYLTLKKAATVPHKHSIKISNFSMLKNVCYSDEFTAGGSKWKIQMYPNGNVDEVGRSLSIFLMIVPSKNTNMKVKVDFSIFLKSQVKSIKDHKYNGSHWFRAAANNWGWSSFISLARLNDADGGFIINDTCLLDVEISVQAVAAQ